MLAESLPRGRAAADRSKRADMTGQREPRQAVARPARTIATAPATAAARQGAPSADMWESLSRDVDPTVDDGTRT